MGQVEGSFAFEALRKSSLGLTLGTHLGYLSQRFP